MAAVSAIVVAGAASAECSERTSTSSCPSPQAASASAATSSAVRAVVAANTIAIMASRLRSAAVSPRLTSRSSASSRANVSALGSPPTRRVAAAWNSSPRRSSRSRSPAVPRSSSQAAIASGSSAARKRTIERPSAACARSLGPLDRSSACSMRPAASGMRAADSAAPRSSRIERRSEAGASSSSARRRNRTAWSGEPRSPARRADVRQRVERPSLADRSGGALGQQVGGHALAPRRIARELARGGEMQLRPLGRRDRVLERLLDDRVHEARRRPGCKSSASISASTAAAAASRSTPATSAVSDREASSPRIASARATAPTAGGRRLSRAATNRATDGGPDGGDRAGVEVRAVAAALLERGDQLAREQRVPARRPGALDADLVSRLRAEAGAHQLGDGRRAERRRPDRRQRLDARSAW